MTNTGGTPAGWYHAPGDPEGTQRYWDGAQWIGDPQATPQQAAAPDPGAADDATVAYTPPPAQPQTPQQDAPPAYGGTPGDATPPNYSAPQAAAPSYQQAAPAGGFQAGGVPAGGAPGGFAAAGGGGVPGAPAEFGQRAIAYLIDLAPVVGWYLVVIILSAISDVLGLIVLLLGGIAVFAYVIWNLYIVQGKTGQTIGKQKQGIKLISDENGEPVGALMAFVRYLVAGAFVLLCCVGQIVNLLAPLWNTDKKTYSDQILKMSVIQVPK